MPFFSKKEKTYKNISVVFCLLLLDYITCFLTGDPSSEYLKTVFPNINND